MRGSLRIPISAWCLAEATPAGELAIEGDGEVVDWLVAMRRLPDDRMLDGMLARRLVTESDLDRLAEVLTGFYKSAKRAAIAPRDYAGRFRKRAGHEPGGPDEMRPRRRSWTYAGDPRPPRGGARGRPCVDG